MCLIGHRPGMESQPSRSLLPRLAHEAGTHKHRQIFRTLANYLPADVLSKQIGKTDSSQPQTQSFASGPTTNEDTKIPQKKKLKAQ